VEVVVLLDASRPGLQPAITEKPVCELESLATADDVEGDQANGHGADEQPWRTQDYDRPGDDDQDPEPLKQHPRGHLK
jgi:hypothetical protein